MSAGLAGKCVLVVEDNSLIALSLAELLSAAGAVVAGPFASCSEAIDFLSHSKPDLAVLDIELVDGRSYPVADQLKELEVGFVVTSGRLTPDAALANAPFLPKPYPDETLLRTLGRLIAS